MKKNKKLIKRIGCLIGAFMVALVSICSIIPYKKQSIDYASADSVVTVSEVVTNSYSVFSRINSIDGEVHLFYVVKFEIIGNRFRIFACFEPSSVVSGNNISYRFSDLIFYHSDWFSLNQSLIYPLTFVDDSGNSAPYWFTSGTQFSLLAPDSSFDFSRFSYAHVYSEGQAVESSLENLNNRVSVQQNFLFF